MPRGSRLGTVVFVLAAVTVSIAGWRYGSSVEVSTAAAGPPVTVDTPPAAVPHTVPVPVPVPAPEPVAERETVEDPEGSKLRLGLARPVGSPATIADANGADVPLFSAPGDAEPGLTLKNPTWEGLPVVFLVMGQQGDWLEVQLSRRPHQHTAWVRAADVSLRQTTYRVVVDSSSKRLTAYDGNTVVMEAPIGVGVGRTPTPTGAFFIDGAVQLANPNGPYGTHQLSVAAFSNVLTSFGGGNGQIAIHGTNQPAKVGSAVSNGCVRMTNDDITRLVSFVPIGTPVEIV